MLNFFVARLQSLMPNGNNISSCEQIGLNEKVNGDRKKAQEDKEG